MLGHLAHAHRAARGLGRVPGSRRREHGEDGGRARDGGGGDVRGAAVRHAVACIPNIGPNGRRRRFIWGVMALAASVLLVAALAVGGADRRWRMGVFLPLWIAALGALQAREKT